jgi:hypothetical protein
MLDPLGDGDWFAMMRANLKTLAQSLGSDAAASEKSGTEAAGEAKQVGSR